MRILIVPSSSGIIHSQAKQHQAATGIDSPVAPVPLVIEPRERLNKSPLARRRLCGMGCAKGDDANGATVERGAVSSEGRCDLEAGC